jgi:phosphatidylserine/phosphatidylglycerophosphate/cardiolipin synthase-like enzyme
MIGQVKQGGTIDITNPGFSSWNEQYDCTYAPEGQNCIGCTPSQMAQETFPLFPAVLNAIHQKGAKVRFMTNNYKQPTCPGLISPFDYWALNGVEVVWYTSTTFTHRKNMRVQTEDGYLTLISSINYSNTSFLQNREAGVIIDESYPAGAAFAAPAVAAFEYDFSHGTPYTVPNSYSPSDMAIITSTNPYPVTIPEPYIPGAFIAPQPYPVTVKSPSTSYVSPDYAKDTLLTAIGSATVSFELYIYQITDTDITNAIVNLYNNGVNVSLLVSNKIYDSTDSQLAQTCYKTLYSAGLKIRRAPSFFRFEHLKMFVIDGKKVGLSSGNFSPSDYPDGSSFVPCTFLGPNNGGSCQSGWQDVNRDANVIIESLDLVRQFRAVRDADWAAGEDWSPNSSSDDDYHSA